MNIIVESIYRHAFSGGRLKMDKKLYNNIYSIIIIYSFNEKGVQWENEDRRLNLRTDLKHYWNYVKSPKENFIFIRPVQ